MLKINRSLLLVTVFIFTQLSLMAQNNTSSPYTRFGYGDLGDRSFGAGRAMGGVGYGLRSSKQINPMNPASYSCMDSLTFLFDFGVAGQVSWFKDDNRGKRLLNGNVEYVAMQFPVHRRIAVSLGLLPFSHVGYEFGKAHYEEGYNFVESYDGHGGFSEFYGGVSVDVWKKRLAVGVNIGYIFGHIYHTQFVDMSSTGGYSTSRAQEMKAKDVVMDFGVQYTHPISKTEKLVFGMTYSPKRNMHTDAFNYVETLHATGSVNEVLSSDTISGKDFGLANKIGIGASYVKRDKLTLAADFSFEDWNRMKYFGEKDHFNNRYRLALGVEYTPNPLNKMYFNKVQYRAGFHFGNSYLRVNQNEMNPKGDSYNEIGASVGFGFPLVDARSFINVSFEYMKKMPDVKVNMIDEQYFRFTLNYTFNELWFFKNKL